MFMFLRPEEIDYYIYYTYRQPECLMDCLVPIMRSKVLIVGVPDPIRILPYFFLNTSVIKLA